jgi:hypothetical protein
MRTAVIPFPAQFLGCPFNIENSCNLENGLKFLVASVQGQVEHAGTKESK